MFHLNLLENNSFHFLCQGRKRRCCAFRWLCWATIFFIRFESWSAKNARKSIWLSHFLDLQIEKSIKRPAWNLLRKSPSKLVCQNLASFWNWLDVYTINFLYAPVDGKYRSAPAPLVVFSMDCWYGEPILWLTKKLHRQPN